MFSIRRCLVQSRKLCTDLSQFCAHKHGTGSGPFVELPDFQPLQDSILLKIPSSSHIFGKLDRINIISAESYDEQSPCILTEKIDNGFFKLSTGEKPVNLICNSLTPLSDIAVVKLDDYIHGWSITDMGRNIMCYSGDLFLNNGRICGRGIFALNIKGSIYQLTLNSEDELLITPESILGYDNNITLNLQKLNSTMDFSRALNNNVPKGLRSFYDKVLLKWVRVFDKDKLYYKVRGPGTLLIQTHFIPSANLYTNKELLNALAK